MAISDQRETSFSNSCSAGAWKVFNLSLSGLSKLSAELRNLGESDRFCNLRVHRRVTRRPTTHNLMKKDIVRQTIRFFVGAAERISTPASLQDSGQRCYQLRHPIFFSCITNVNC